MRRTRGRPVPSGRVRDDEALALGLALSGFSVTILALATNLVASALLAFTIFFYAVVYTMWLKRRTPQNIVIGGLAGALPPLVGWAAATGSVGVAPLMMVALIFMWTPPHFWALALFMKEDYAAAGVPMLTVTHGRPAARRHILAYSVALAPVALGLGFTSVGGAFYLAVSVALNLWFMAGALAVARRDEDMATADDYAAEKRLFRVSLWYLTLHFVALLVQASLGQEGLW